MHFLNSIYLFILILLQLANTPSSAQQLHLQTFSLASNYFAATQVDGLQLDWRLDLGLSAMPLDQSNRYHFSAGFFQPTINRFAKDALEGKFNPSIELRNSFQGDAMLLFSKEPDLILFGYSVYNLHGQVVVSDQTKYRSGYAGKKVDMNGLPSGVYIMQVFYLPEFMMIDGIKNYSIKTIKFIKP